MECSREKLLAHLIRVQTSFMYISLVTNVKTRLLPKVRQELETRESSLDGDNIQEANEVERKNSRSSFHSKNKNRVKV